MLSLDNVHNTEQLKSWLKRIQKNIIITANTADNNNKNVTILTEPKLDGLSLSIRYQKEEQGTLVRLLQNLHLQHHFLQSHRLL